MPHLILSKGEDFKKVVFNFIPLPWINSRNVNKVLLSYNFCFRAHFNIRFAGIGNGYTATVAAQDTVK